ncbi:MULTISPECIES: beta-glucoside-specific PTS transporter subunit IIABC [unclassified Paenibacillus]|uniref:beta-glucoside-specific PTS transporter subunit IIABC n=1 Tax=unclassified Paenibacillus TaxID=185978 RepID=UPI000CFC44F0|nr:MULTISPECIES: beta-glucoside-specific PTS transporter subunit IIABC [unclassified Paenibacillus]PRA07839.1 PTS beta-glucoside transporter subunit EIIBCA [Paenibacillus sp. MYb63]PRA51483.1 PTS beta-glucoside transporter subunit EIIBCA [Paenibacillus sp. MYb67]
MNYEKTAKDILNYVGGKQNVAHLGHCATRLRFTLKDDRQADVEAIKKVPGVLDVVNKGQFQVVVGNTVVEVYDELMKVGGFGGQKENEAETKSNDFKQEKKKIGSMILDFFVSVFQPLIPAMAGAGILKSMLLLLSVIGLIDSKGSTYIVLTSISGAVFYFLPILVALTTAAKLKVNHVVAAAAMSVLLFPDMIANLGSGASFLSIPLTNVNYASQVFPSILGVIFYAFMERFFFKVSPKPIRVFFVPMMSLLLTVPVTLAVLGPIGFHLGSYLTAAILFLFANFGWLAVGILAAILPFMIATGMHKALTPYGISVLAASGKELLLLPALFAHNMAESAASFAVAIRTKDTRLRGVAVSAAISAMFGITEPALYGVTLQRKRVLISIVISSLIGGLSLGFLGVASSTLVSPSLASITMFIDQNNKMNFVYAILGMVISYVISFVLTLFLWNEDTQPSAESTIAENKETTKNTVVKSNEVVAIKQPVQGEIIPLTEVKDDVFSTKSMGEGIAVIPSKGELYAPTDGTVKMVFRTQHAVAMETANGSELLFHIGIDTVKLKGKFFESQIKIGDQVKAGDVLVKFDIEGIVKAGYDPVLITVVTSREGYNVQYAEGDHKDNDPLMFITTI